MSNLKKYWVEVLLILLSAVPLVWFFKRGNILIDGIDTNFPLDPAVWLSRRLFVWSDVTNGGVDFSSSVAGTFFHLIQFIPFKIGLSLQQVEITSLIFWFLTINLSAYFLAKVLFPKRGLIQIMMVVFYSFNIFMFNSWENVKVANLSLVAAIPAGLAILILMERKALSWRQAGLPIALTAIVLSGSGINPAYFICFFLIMAIFSLSQIMAKLKKPYLLDRVKDFIFMSVIVVLVNLFWILPTGYFIFRNIPESGSISTIGFNNWVDSLSENTSLFNVIRLQGAWDWYSVDATTGIPLYIPYALNYFYNPPFLLFSFLIPLIVISAFLIRNENQNYLYIGFGMMLISGIFLGTGTHQPTGAFYQFLLDHLPFFTLFRSPWYIFTPLLTVAYAVLISVFFANLADRYPKKSLILNVVLIILVVGNLIYSYPLVTGKIFRPQSPGGFYVNFPQYIFDSKTYLKQNQAGRIIGYPDDEIENFSWGYRGVESILNLFSQKETLFAPLNMPASPIASMIKEFYSDLKKGQIESAKNIAQVLDIQQIFEKKDQPSLSLPLPSSIKNQPVNFGKWVFYQMGSSQKLYFADSINSTGQINDSAQVIGLLKPGAVLINPKDSVVSKIVDIQNLSSKVVLAQNLQQNDLNNFINGVSQLNSRLVERDLSKVVYQFRIDQPTNYQPILENYRLEDFGIDLHHLVVNLDNNPIALDFDHADDSNVYFKPTFLQTGNHQLSLSLKNQNLAGSPTESSEPYTNLRDENGDYLSIFNNTQKDMGIKFPINNFNPLQDYLVQVKYRQIYGNNANIVIGQSNQSTLIKSQIERLPNYPSWNTFSFYFEPVRTNSQVQVSLEAPFISDPLGTTINYRELGIFKIFTNRLAFVSREQQLQTPQINFKKVSPVEYEAKVTGSQGRQLLVFNENYSPDWQLTTYNSNGSKLSLNPQHFSANFYANGWYLEGPPENYTIKIYYFPQKLYYLGAFLSALTALILIGFFKKVWR